MVGPLPAAEELLHNAPAEAWTIATLAREPRATVGSVAPQGGYSSAFALSAAFKRVRGVSPAAHRAAVA